MRRKPHRAHPRADAVIGTALPLGDARRFEPKNRRRLSGPGLRTFIAIADRWGLTEDEQLKVLGLPERAIFDDWVARARERRELTLSADVLLRLSGVLGIYKALTILYGHDDDEAVDWLRGPHDAPAFGGQPPIAFLTDGTLDGVLLVRRYLDDFILGG